MTVGSTASRNSSPTRFGVRVRVCVEGSHTEQKHRTAIRVPGKQQPRDSALHKDAEEPVQIYNINLHVSVETV